MSKHQDSQRARLRRKFHIRKKVAGTSERPRLAVFRSARHIYAQLVDDRAGRTVCSASSLTLGREDVAKGNRAEAADVGRALAAAAAAAGISQVVFDRNGFLFHGRIKALADAARESGLVF